MTTRLTLVHAMSPLHAGTGQSVGAIDLPIAREKPTGVPLLPGSSLKGALRALSQKDPQITRDIFGPETAQSSEHSGSVQFSDVHLLLLPVRSVRGIFAWVTSTYLLRRFSRNAREAGVDLGTLPASPSMNGCRVLSETLSLPAERSRKVVFEDLDFLVESGGSELGTLAEKLGKMLFPDGSRDAESWRASLRDRICLIHDDIMALLLETATEVNAHIRLSPDTKTVERGGLWYQESLPAESVLSGLLVAADVKEAKGRSERSAAAMLSHLHSLAGGLIQLGGKATVGQGSCFLRLAGGLA